MSIPVSEGYQIKDVYSFENEEVVIADGSLRLTMNEDKKAVAVYLEK